MGAGIVVDNHNNYNDNDTHADAVRRKDGGRADAPAADAGSADAELERLKARRLAEMQQNLAAQKEREESEAAVKDAGKNNAQTPRDLVVSLLGFRGLEVLESAESQYPKEMPFVIGRLAEIIRTERISERIDGGQLMAVFRMLGLPVRIRTSIKIVEDGKTVSLSDKIGRRRGPGAGDADGKQ